MFLGLSVPVPGPQDFTKSTGECTVRQTDHQNVWLALIPIHQYENYVWLNTDTTKITKNC